MPSSDSSPDRGKIVPSKATLEQNKPSKDDDIYALETSQTRAVDKKVRAGTVTTKDLITWGTKYGKSPQFYAATMIGQYWYPIIQRTQPDVAAKIHFSGKNVGVTGSDGSDTVFAGDHETVQGDDPNEHPVLKDVADAVTSPLEAVGKLVSAMFTIQFWIRALEFIIAAMLVAIGMAKLAGDAGATGIERRIRKVIR